MNKGVPFIRILENTPSVPKFLDYLFSKLKIDQLSVPSKVIRTVLTMRVYFLYAYNI